MTAQISPKLASGVAGCEHFLEVVREGERSDNSRVFERDDVQVSTTVEMYPSPAAVSAQLDLLRDPTTLICERALFLKFLTEGEAGTVNSIDVSPIAIDPLGDGEFASRITASIDAVGQPITLLTDRVGVQVGKFAFSFEVFGTTVAELAELETTLLPKLVDRMRQAGA